MSQNPLDELRRSVVTLLKEARPVIEQFKETWKQILPVLQVLVEVFRAFPEHLRRSLLMLGSHGWYLGPDMPAAEFLELSNAFSNSEKSDADKLLCKWIDDHLAEIEALLIDRFPLRNKIIGDAFEAHRLGLYSVSIPAFLAQTDGMCQELHGVELFKKNKSGKLLIKNKIQKFEISECEEAMLAPLLEPLPIVAGRQERSSLSNLLNRHAILHGESVDYGTYENSCRAISLISYASWALAGIVSA